MKGTRENRLSNLKRLSVLALVGVSFVALSGCGASEDSGPTPEELASDQFNELIWGKPAGIEARAEAKKIKLDDGSGIFEARSTGNNVTSITSEVELGEPSEAENGSKVLSGEAQIVTSTTFGPAVAKKLGGKSIQKEDSVPVELTLDEADTLTAVALGESSSVQEVTKSDARPVAERAIRAFLSVDGPPSDFRQYENNQSEALVGQIPTRIDSPRDEGHSALVDEVAATYECPDNAVAQLFAGVPPNKTTIKSLKVAETDPVAEIAPGLDQAGFVAKAVVQGQYDCAGGLLGDESEITRSSPVDLRVSLVRLPDEDWKIARLSARNVPNGYADQFFGNYETVIGHVSESMSLVGPDDQGLEPEPWIEEGLIASELAGSANASMKAADVVNRWLSAKGDPELAAEVCAESISKRLTEKYGVEGCSTRVGEMEPELSPMLIGADMAVKGQTASYDTFDYGFWLVREDGEWKMDRDDG